MLLFDYLKYQYYKWKLQRLVSRVHNRFIISPFKWENFKGIKTKEEEHKALDKEIDKLMKEWENIRDKHS